MKVFWDTNIFIYLFKKDAAFHSKVQDLHREQRSRGDQILTSALTLGELLVRPLRGGRQDLADTYRGLLSEGGAVSVVPFDHTAAEAYAQIRSKSTVRQPDAIQLACASAAGARTFITNDRELWTAIVPGIDTIRGL